MKSLKYVKYDEQCGVTMTVSMTMGKPIGTHVWLTTETGVIVSDDNNDDVANQKRRP